MIDGGIKFEEMGVVQSCKTLKMCVCCYRCDVLVPVHVLATADALFLCLCMLLAYWGKYTIWSATFLIYACGI